MTDQIEKILNPFVLLFINLSIVVLAEFVGGGMFFYRTGIIHVIALGFIGLAALRVRAHYYSYDQYLEKVMHASLIAMGIFAISHIFEAVSFSVFHAYEDPIFASVANFYIISLLVITIGTELFLKKLFQRSYALVIFLEVLVVGFFALSIYFIKDGSVVSLEPDSVAVPLYAVAIFAAGLYALLRLRQIKSHVPMSSNFLNYYIASIVLIVIAALFNIGYEILVDKFHVPEFQVIYMSHFLFYGALSLMFLAFNYMRDLGGFLGQVRAQNKKNETTLA